MSGATDTEYLKVYGEHQKAWWKAYGNGFLLGALASVGGMAGALALISQVDGMQAFRAPIFIAALAVIIGWAVFAYKRNQGQMTIGELTVLQKSLAQHIKQPKLRGVFEDYLATIIELESSNTLEESEKADLRDQLNSMLSEADRLCGQFDMLANAHGNFDEKQRLSVEIGSLEQRINNSKDADAKEALGQAKKIALKRLESFEQGGPVMERIEAQLELMRQTLGAFRETLARLRGTPSFSPQLEVGGLREQLLSIQTQSQALESAFQELNMVRLTE